MRHYHSINSTKKPKKAKLDDWENQTKNPTVEWVHVSLDKTDFATSKKADLVDSNAVRLTSLPDYYSDNYSDNLDNLDNLAGLSNGTISLENAERIAITKNLLDGAIATAKHEKIQRIIEPKTANLSLGES